MLNPNQKQQREDERRYREKLQQLNESGECVHRIQDEDDEDVEILDKYDAFYYATKSLLNLFQIMGIMPIMRSAKGEKNARTTFRFCSLAFYWAYFIYGVETVIVVLVAQERIAKFISNSDKRFDEVIYNVIFISILVPHFLLPFASWRNGAEVAKFKNMWTDFQVKFYRVTGSSMVFPKLYEITWSLSIFSWILSVFICVSEYHLQPDFQFWHTFAYYHILAMLNCFCSLWYINCKAFGTASSMLSKKLEECLESENPAQMMTKYRHLWVDLSHQMQQLGRAYSNMYGIYCLVIFFTTIIATYGALSEILDHGATYKELGLFVIVIYFMSLLFIICNEAHIATDRVGLAFQDMLLNVNLTCVDPPTQKEVEMFLVAIAKNPPTMNLDGFADINRKLITSNISFMATYLVVLLQFKLSLLRQSARDNVLEDLKSKKMGG